MSIFNFNHIDKNKKQKKRYRRLKSYINITTIGIGVIKRRTNTLRN